MCILIFKFYLQDVIYCYLYIQYTSKTFTDFIPKYKKENNEIKLNEESEKIKKLEEENKKLKDNLNKISKDKDNEINRLKAELQKLKNENVKLKSDLLKANKIISGIQNNQIDNSPIQQLLRLPVPCREARS